jgi:hypothetical protein
MHMDKRASWIYLIVAMLVLVITMNMFAIYPVSAQTNGTSNNMTSSEMASTRLHLKLADQAIMNGDTKEAFTQLNLAQLQLSMTELKSAGTLNGTQAMVFMKSGGGAVAPNTKVTSDHCIVDNEGKLECRYPR